MSGLQSLALGGAAGVLVGVAGVLVVQQGWHSTGSGPRYSANENNCGRHTSESGLPNEPKYNRSRFVPKAIKGGNTGMIAAPNADEYLKLIEQKISPGDVVLNVTGASVGDCPLAKVVGPKGKVVRIQPRQLRVQGALGEVAQSVEFTNVICVDVVSLHGADLLLDSLRLIDMLKELFRPALVLIKSRVLTKHATQVWPGPKFVSLHSTKKLRKCGQGMCRILATVGVSAYRDTIDLVVNKSGCLKVLEIGCALGTTTRLIYNAAVACCTEGEADTGIHVVGVDTGAKCVKKSINQSSNGIQYARRSGWDTRALFEIDSGFEAIYVDIGGLSGTDGLYETLVLLRMLEATFNETLKFIVIKSRCLSDHASAFTHADLHLSPDYEEPQSNDPVIS